MDGEDGLEGGGHPSQEDHEGQGEADRVEPHQAGAGRSGEGQESDKGHQQGQAAAPWKTQDSACK